MFSREDHQYCRIEPVVPENHVATPTDNMKVVCARKNFAHCRDNLVIIIVSLLSSSYGQLLLAYTWFDASATRTDLRALAAQVQDSVVPCVPTSGKFRCFDDWFSPCQCTPHLRCPSTFSRSASMTAAICIYESIRESVVVCQSPFL